MEPKTPTPEDDEDQNHENNKKTTPGKDKYETPGKNDYSTPGNDENPTPGKDEEFGNYKVLNYFEEKDFFLVSNNYKKNGSENNYFLKRISLYKNADKSLIYEKLKKFNLGWFERISNDKIIIFIAMEVTKGKNFNVINKIIVNTEEQALFIFINLIIELNFLRNNSIKYNLNSYF